MFEYDVVIDDSLRHEGDNNVLVWKHPVEDYDTPTKVVVRESQEAVLVVDGIIERVYGAGAYIIDPREWRNSYASTRDYPIHSQTFFVNLVEQMAIPWGTSSKLQYLDPQYGFPLSIGASGQLSVGVSNSKRLIQKLVGTANSFEKYQLKDVFNAFLMTQVKTYLAQEIKSNSISIFEIDERLEDLSSAIKDKLKDDFKEYGLLLSKFYITTIAMPDKDPLYNRYKDIHFRKYADIEDAKIRQDVGIIDQQTESQKIEIEAKALAKKREIEGYTYQEEHNIDVRESSGEKGQYATIFCDKCGQKLMPNSLFCHSCGASQKDDVKCKKCGFVFLRDGRYCPNCGAKRY